MNTGIGSISLSRLSLDWCSDDGNTSLKIPLSAIDTPSLRKRPAAGGAKPNTATKTRQPTPPGTCLHISVDEDCSEALGFRGVFVVLSNEGKDADEARYRGLFSALSRALSAADAMATEHHKSAQIVRLLPVVAGAQVLAIERQAIERQAIERQAIERQAIERQGNELRYSRYGKATLSGNWFTCSADEAKLTDDGRSILARLEAKLPKR